MIALEVAKKYAHALMMSAEERGLVDQGFEQLSSVLEHLRQDSSLMTFLGSPRITEAQKLQMVRDAFGDKLERLFVEFFLVLVKKHRAVYLPEILDEFIRLVEFHKGIVRATVTTAVPLTPDQENDLINRLVARTGKQIVLEKKVDQTIIAGMIIVVADEIVDGSVRHELRQLEEQLRKIKVA